MFTTCYHGEIELKTGRVIYVDATARWRLVFEDAMPGHPRPGFVPELVDVEIDIDDDNNLMPAERDEAETLVSELLYPDD